MTLFFKRNFLAKNVKFNYMYIGVIINEFQNSSPRPDGKRKGAQAVALRVSGDKAAFYNCRLIGFQDTLCDDRGRHFFHECYVEGTVDYIFGSGKSLYLVSFGHCRRSQYNFTSIYGVPTVGENVVLVQSTELHTKGDGGFSVITAQARNLESEDNGYSFVHCTLSGTGGNTFLGRAWMSRPRVVFSYTFMSSVVSPLGWSDNDQPERDS